MTARPAISFDDHRRTRRFAALDGLRAIAVLMVIAYHCPRLSLPFVGTIQGMGDTGVDVFFVLSGFLITTLLLREPPAPAGGRLARFWGRRVLRIFPLYFLAILVYWVTAHAGADPEAGALYDRSLPWFLTYNIDVALAADPAHFPHFGIAWSLGVEEKFYLLWPLLVVALPARRLLATTAALIVAIGAWRFWLAHDFGGDLAGRLYYGADMRMDGILWGCLLAVTLNGRAGFRAVRGAVAGPLVLPLALAVYAAAAITFDNAAPLRYVLVSAGLTVALAAVLVRPTRAALRPLHWRPVAYVGAISYGIYVFHPLAGSLAVRVTGATGDLASIACALLTTALTIAIAAASFHLYEAPFLAVKRRLSTAQGPPDVRPLPWPSSPLRKLRAESPPEMQR